MTVDLLVPVVVTHRQLPALEGTHVRNYRYAWCFDHGTMHRFPVGEEPWCTAAWVAFTAATIEDADQAKQAAYGDARFLDQLPADKQIEVIEIGEARR